jgi:YVTN family beta-propeller protein
MLIEQDFDQLSCEINNPGAPNTIYITSDESVNKLVLTITTNTPGTQFTPGQLVPINEAPNASGSILYLNLSALKLTAEEFNKIECAAQGWQWKLYTPASVCLTPTTDITLGNGPGDQINININKFTIGTPPGIANLSLSVDYFRVSPITFMDSLPLTTYFSVLVQAAPGGQHNLHDHISCQLAFEPYICNSIPGYDPVANSLSFVLKRLVNSVIVPAGADTLFTLSMVYADSKPGYGALTTPQKVINDITVTHGQNASEWIITKIADKENPCWTLKPPKDKPIVGEGTKATVQFDISNIITDFEPGPTIMMVEYKNVEGYNAGSFAILLMKVPHVSIPVFSVTPNPSYLEKDDKSPIHLQWTVKDAGTLMLYPLPGNVTGKSFYDTEIPANTQYLLEARGKQLSANGNVATKQVNAIVLPRINSFSADPVFTYYKSFPTRVRLDWNVDSPNKVSLVSSVTGPNPISFNPVGSVDYDIAKPQMITLEPGGVKNPQYMRRVVLSAFKIGVRTENLPEMPMTDMVCMPNGNIIFGISGTYSYVRIIDALTLKSIAPSVPVTKIPRGIALSPDGKLLYVPSQDGVVTVFQVMQAAMNNILLTVLTTLTNVGKKLWQLALSPSGNEFYVTDGDAAGGVLLVFRKSADNQFTCVAKVGVQAFPMHVTVSPSGGHIFVSNANSNSVTAIARLGDGNFSAVATIRVGDSPHGIAVSPNGEYFFVCNHAGNTVSIISAKTFSVVGSLPTAKHPQQLVFSRSSDYVFVACSGGVTLVGLNHNTKQYVVLESAISVSNGHGGHGICMSPGGNQVFVTPNPQMSELNALSMTAYEKANSITGLNMQPTSAVACSDGSKVLVWRNPRILPENSTPGVVVINAGNYAFSHVLADCSIYDLVYSPDNKLLYVIQGKDGKGTVHAKNTVDYSDKGQLQGLTAKPLQLLVSTDGSLLFVSVVQTESSNAVAIVQTSDMTIVNTVKLQASSNVMFIPLAAMPDMSKIFAAQKDVVSIIEKDAGGYTLLNKTIAAANNLDSLTMLPDGSRVIGLCNQARTISVINTNNYSVQNIVIPESFGNNITGLAVSPDGRNVVLSATDKSAILFLDMVNYTAIYAVATDQSPQCAVYLPNGAQIFVSCQSGVSVVKQIQAR